MANTKSAKKALRQAKRREAHNLSYEGKIKALVRSIKTKGGSYDILTTEYQKLQSLLDKAVKEKVIHKNKAARIKSRLIKSVHDNKSTPRSKGRRSNTKSESNT